MEKKRWRGKKGSESKEGEKTTQEGRREAERKPNRNQQKKTKKKKKISETK